MPKIDMLLWANDAQDWVVDVDGARCEHLSPTAIQLFVRFALMHAERSHVACTGSVWTLSCFVSAIEPGELWAAHDTDSPEWQRPQPLALQ